MADWTEHTLSGLNEDQLQKMLACEFGGMNEILVNIYSITGNPKYLALSYKFQHKAILDPLAAGLDPLAGKHSNTQIPKILGCVRRYELKGDAADRRIAENFWNIVVKHHSYVIGGNSDHEYLADPDKLSDYLSESTCESCNTYNMLKLTRHLFCLQPSSTLGDYYERALYNHILASQNPQDGMMCYFVPLRMGAKKQFSDSFNTFTCCVGSGMENHSKYAESIYYEGPDSSLLINLFIPSVLNWTSRHMMVEQQTDFPRSDTVLFTIKSQKPAFFKIQIRIPWWAGSALQLRVNGRAIAYTKQAKGYAGIERPWRNGDKISMVLPMHLYYESMPDNPNRVAFLYGPLVLAGDLGQTPVTDFHKVPVMLTGDKDISHWLKPAADRPLTFRTDGIGRPFDVTFRPFYQHYDNAYSVYWDFFSNADWAKREADYEAEQNRVHDIETRTVDLLRVGEMQPERDHHFMGENTYVGDEQDRKSRNAHTEGWFSFTLKVDTARPNSLLVTYWGGDNGRIHDILIDGVLLVTQELHHEHPNKFFDLEYPLDDSLVRGKSSITIRFQAHTGKTTGDIYGCRVIRK